MNQNYIAPEALDDATIATCYHCKASFSDVERKIKFYQGLCPNCGYNPTAFAVPSNQESNKTPVRASWTNSYVRSSNYDYNFGRTVTPTTETQEIAEQPQSGFPSDDANTLQQMASVADPFFN
jgi:predicted  nucleic acid-binding Zn-ribbon protein